MELKLIWVFNPDKGFCLLIVPYGIETGLTAIIKGVIDVLLIVPYGIETTKDSLNAAKVGVF